MLKKVLPGFLAAALILTAAGCGTPAAGQATASPSPAGSPQVTESSSQATEAAPEETEPASALSDDQVRALAFGAVLATRNEMDYHTLIGAPDDFVAAITLGIEESWGVTDHDTAIETLDWLKTEGHRLYNFDDAYNIFMGREETDDDLNEFFAAELNACPIIQQALKDEYGYTDEELEAVATTSAWDYDRMVTLARWCYAAGYISEQEAWSYIDFAVEQGTNDYDNWRAYFAGVMYGRAMWAESEQFEFDDKEIGDMLLKDATSIYNQVPFK